MNNNPTLKDVIGPDPEPKRDPLPDNILAEITAHFGERLSSEDFAWLASLFGTSVLAVVDEFIRRLNGLDGPAPIPCRFLIQKLLDEVSAQAIRHNEIEFAVKHLRIAIAELENPDLRAEPPEPADFAA